MWLLVGANGNLLGVLLTPRKRRGLVYVICILNRIINSKKQASDVNSK